MAEPKISTTQKEEEKHTEPFSPEAYEKLHKDRNKIIDTCIKQFIISNWKACKMAICECSKSLEGQIQPMTFCQWIHLFKPNFSTSELESNAFVGLYFVDQSTFTDSELLEGLKDMTCTNLYEQSVFARQILEMAKPAKSETKTETIDEIIAMAKRAKTETKTETTDVAPKMDRPSENIEEYTIDIPPNCPRLPTYTFRVDESQAIIKYMREQGIKGKIHVRFI